MISEPQVFVSLGANLGDMLANFERARRAIAALPGTEITAFSAEKLTEPIGVVEQPEFLNQVVRLATQLEPQDLMEALLRIEHSLGRVRAERWGLRTIDLDILFYGSIRLETPELTIPHPELPGRPFFLEMVAEIDESFLDSWPEFGGREGC